MKKAMYVSCYIAAFALAIVFLVYGWDTKRCRENGYTSVRYAAEAPYDAYCYKNDNSDVLWTRLKTLYE